MYGREHTSREQKIQSLVKHTQEDNILLTTGTKNLIEVHNSILCICIWRAKFLMHDSVH